MTAENCLSRPHLMNIFLMLSRSLRFAFLIFHLSIWNCTLHYAQWYVHTIHFWLLGSKGVQKYSTRWASPALWSCGGGWVGWDHIPYTVTTTKAPAVLKIPCNRCFEISAGHVLKQMHWLQNADMFGRNWSRTYLRRFPIPAKDSAKTLWCAGKVE